MTERPKVHDWKSCVPGRVPRVQIPLSPKIYLLVIELKLIIKLMISKRLRDLNRSVPVKISRQSLALKNSGAGRAVEREGGSGRS